MGRFETVKDDADFGMDDDADDITITAGKWNEVGALTVGAQSAIQFGVGITTAQGTDTRETAKIRLDSLAGEIVGKIRLRVSDANENREETIIEGLTSEWTAGKKVGLSEVAGGEDDILKIEIRPNETTVVDMDDADTSVAIPVTETTRR